MSILVLNSISISKSINYTNVSYLLFVISVFPVPATLHEANDGRIISILGVINHHLIPESECDQSPREDKYTNRLVV